MNELHLAAAVTITLLLVANLWVYLRVLAPLRRLNQQVKHLTEGNFNAFQHDCGGTREIEDLRQSMASMADHVRRAQEESSAYRNALTEGQEAERARLAHDLHDDTVQSFVVLAHQIEIATQLIINDPQKANSLLVSARQQAVDAAKNLRGTIANLRPPALEELGLVAALHILATEVKSPKVEFTTSGIERRFEDNFELNVYRVAQEGLRNAIQHAAANHISMTLTFAESEIHLSIQDNGKGMVQPQTLRQFASSGHFGLVGIAERVESLKGTLRISSKTKQGTTLTIALPSAVQQSQETETDPVCGVVIQPHQAFGNVDYDGNKYFFCCPVCQGAFTKHPEMYARA